MRVGKKELNFIKGQVRFDEPMSLHTTFRIGGPADIWIAPKDTQELTSVLKYAKENKIKAVVLGGGSKILVSDKGVRGFVISLSSAAFRYIKYEDSIVELGAGVRLPEMIRKTALRNLGGCEFLSGVPGTVGGAIVMNAGWPLAAIGDFVEEVTAISALDTIKLRKGQIKFSYRSSGLDKLIILGARLKMLGRDKDEIMAELKQNLKRKKESQDLSYPSLGSVFKNPAADLTAGKLIEMSGFKGYSFGDAAVSEKHANFIINRGKAKAADVIALVKEIQKKVFKDHGIMLKLEAKFIGEF